MRVCRQSIEGFNQFTVRLGRRLMPPFTLFKGDFNCIRFIGAEKAIGQNEHIFQGSLLASSRLPPSCEICHRLRSRCKRRFWMARIIYGRPDIQRIFARLDFHYATSNHCEAGSSAVKASQNAPGHYLYRAAVGYGISAFSQAISTCFLAINGGRWKCPAVFTSYTAPISTLATVVFAEFFT